MVSIVRLRRRFRNLTITKVVIILVLSVIIFNEFLVYTLQSFRWVNIPTARDPDEEIVILCVSDPQLIGVQDEMGFPIGSIARWDSDSYLRKTFSRAYHHTQPDVIIFMGDIMDEGSKATAEEYESYYKRFHDIFYETSYTKTIVVPGDNDIGGEGGDFRTPFKVNRFEKHFENLTGLVSYNFVDFLKLDIVRVKDRILETKQLISEVSGSLKGLFRIVVNHECMITKQKGSIYPILRMAQPSVLLSGHWHLSKMYTCGTCLSDDNDMNNWPYHERDISRTDNFVEVDFTNLIALNEIMVPTCSYRMGVPDMGYGVVIINKSGQMKYTVLWLPSRYTLLYIYVGVLAIVGFLLMVDFIFSPVSRKNSYR